MFVTVDFLIKLTCSFPDKSELISLNKKLKLSRHNPHYHHRFAEAIALKFLQPQKRRVSMHDFRSRMPKTHFRFDLHLKLLANTKAIQTHYFTFGPRSQKRRQRCVDREGTGTHPNTPS